ncbi:hypothetical protein GIB67_006487 [Kingdonia uniflora]|uniref:Legume lectin domain-containing protein n=1 Tax=Kingdonia uniflora TaxID=39325 RepID=A0A7J7LEQ8_9MAGN|nr:hypothetical protein GIB67_006487 [Kingdonia uniflora]
MGSPGKLVIIFLLLFLTITTTKEPLGFEYRSFNATYPSTLRFTRNAAPGIGALQITLDTSSTFDRFQKKFWRIVYKTPFKLWEGDVNSPAGKIASLNTSFDVNIYRHINTTPGNGLAFIIAPDLDIPAQSYGPYQGLANVSTDGN